MDIVSAIYGADNTYIDVSSIVLKFSSKEFYVSNNIFGDPLPNVKKKLIIVYKNDKVITFKEKEFVTLYDPKPLTDLKLILRPIKKYFITFGGGDKKYIDAGNRLLQQARNLNLFDETIFYTDTYLQHDDFWNIHSSFVENNQRGYGYWLWKPYLIKKTMEQMDNNDILLYLDCGCEIDIRKKRGINFFFEIVKKHYIIGSFTNLEREWNKMDLVLELGMLNDEYLNTPQREAGALMFLVCENTRNLVNQWYEIACNYHLIDDSPSINENFPTFKEHRHDQSIFSLLSKKYNLYSNFNIWSIVEYIRNISSKSMLA
jgi:hypothetical protein